jgi:LytS/YehU family sensor histidine kinase
VQAANKDGIWSNSLIVPLNVNSPWWKTYIFYIFIAILFIGLIYGIFQYRVRHITKEQMLITQLNSLKTQALLAQMNPHFIFNAFSAIQYFIHTDEINKADDYLADFSYLIRKTLQNSKKKNITLHEEINLLRLYTQLEVLRFENKFKIIFEVDKKLETMAIKVPSMLLQPLVENAINHGLMHLQDKKGILKIGFYSLGEKLRCIIEDNGVGMNRGKELKIKKQNESLGLNLTYERIKSYEQNGEFSIQISSEDLADQNGNSGTRFIIDIA